MKKATKKDFEVPRHPLIDLCTEIDGLCTEVTELLEEIALGLKRDFVVNGRAHLEQKMTERNIRSFDDLLIQTHGALTGPGGAQVVNRLRERYRAALIDEFQDTDPLQYEIFLRVFGDAHTPLYLIGDPKQSIYGFRGADLFAYLRAARSVESRYTLTMNYRSTDRVVTGVNALFGNAPRPFVFEDIVYRTARAVREGQGAGMVVRVMAARHHTSRGRISKERASEIAAGAAARDVGELLSSGIRASGIAVLVRKNRQAGEVKSALDDAGIPAVVYGAQSVYATTEAVGVHRILLAVLYPGDQGRVFAALATGILGRTAAELHRYQVDDAARGEYEEIVSSFWELRELWVRQGFGRMFGRLLRRFEVRRRLLREDRGERRVTNVLHLLELLNEAESHGGLGCDGLEGYLARRRAEAPESGEHVIRLESDADAVTVITVHRSKGLQFDYVICPHLWEGVGNQRSEFVFYDRARDDLPVVVLKGSARELAAARMEELAESVRLLYVAVTRARQQVVVYWGRVNKAWTSPLFYLLHGGQVDTADIEAGLREIWNDTTEEDTGRVLSSLAASSSGSLEVTDIDEILDRPGAVPASGPADERLRPPRSVSNAIPSGWRIASYSWFARSVESAGKDRVVADHDRQAGIVADHDKQAGIVADHDRGTGVPSVAEEYSGREHQSIHEFPRGAGPGIMIHSLLEETDFRDPEPHRPERLRRACRAHGFAEEWANPLGRMIDDVVSAPLRGPENPPSLAGVGEEDRLNELQFFLPMGPARPGDLVRLLGEHDGGGHGAGPWRSGVRAGAGLPAGFH